MISAEHIYNRVADALPAARIETVLNPGPAAQHSILVAAEDAVAVAHFLRDDDELRLDYCSNVSGVDWPESPAAGKGGDGDPPPAAYIEVVYHLYSVHHRHGPVVLRMRTANRTDWVTLPSLTPVWRSAEFQEREVYDLYGVKFSGHPDLRRLLMWDDFEGHPMRRDFVEPPDEDGREPFTPATVKAERKAPQ